MQKKCITAVIFIAMIIARLVYAWRNRSAKKS
jgi:NADH:ubiquinone oxidoreductase subunit 3 (subunit A)